MKKRDDNQGYQRDLLSVKRKWGNCVAAVATYPKKFFEDKNGVTDEEQDFLVKLAAEAWKLANKWTEGGEQQNVSHLNIISNQIYSMLR